LDKPDPLLDPNYLPDNVPECHKLIGDLRNRVKSLEERVATLEKQLQSRNRMLFGKRSAKVSSTILTGTGKAIYEANAKELEEEQNNLQLLPPDKAHGGGGRTAPANAPCEQTIEHTITNPSELACPCCGTVRKVMGFRVSQQLDIMQAAFLLLKHIQYTYSCPKCQGEIVTAPKPEQPFGKGYATGGLVAHIANAKFNWHLPLYRQEEIYRAQTVPIARSSMCRWPKEGAAILALIVKRMHQLILNSRFIQSDTTTMPVIKKGLGRTHKGVIWIFRGEETQPYIIYEFTESGSGEHATRMLTKFKGFLVTDGSSVFNGVIEGGASTVNCWAHAYRYFEEAKDFDEELAGEAIAMIKGLFDVERVAADMSEADRQDLRQRVSKARLAVLKIWLDEQVLMADFLPKSKFGEAVNYCLNRWNALCRYVDTGFLPIDNNWSENGLRPAVLGRKNWLFAGSVEGGRTAAIFMSIIHTCRRLGINPFEYMQDVLTRFPSATTSQVDDFLPDRWSQLRSVSH
jgi:transposase